MSDTTTPAVCRTMIPASRMPAGWRVMGGDERVIDLFYETSGKGRYYRTPDVDGVYRPNVRKASGTETV